jgi:hypothetical protein
MSKAEAETCTDTIAVRGHDKIKISPVTGKPIAESEKILVASLSEQQLKLIEQKYETSSAYEQLWKQLISKETMPEQLPLTESFSLLKVDGADDNAAIFSADILKAFQHVKSDNPKMHRQALLAGRAQGKRPLTVDEFIDYKKQIQRIYALKTFQALQETWFELDPENEILAGSFDPETPLDFWDQNQEQTLTRIHSDSARGITNIFKQLGTDLVRTGYFKTMEEYAVFHSAALHRTNIAMNRKNGIFKTQVQEANFVNDSSYYRTWNSEVGNYHLVRAAAAMFDLSPDKYDPQALDQAVEIANQQHKDIALETFKTIRKRTDAYLEKGEKPDLKFDLDVFDFDSTALSKIIKETSKQRIAYQTKRITSRKKNKPFLLPSLLTDLAETDPENISSIEDTQLLERY